MEFASQEKMQSYLEEIDVENGEYQAWDREGLSVRLFVIKKSAWLGLEYGLGMEYASESVGSLRQAILEYGKTKGLEPDKDDFKFSDFLREIERA